MREDRPVAYVEVTEESLRAFAGDAVFVAALAMADKVTDLRADGPQVEATVDGVVVSVRFLPYGIDGRCGCPLTMPCPHAVAAAVALVRTGEDGGPAPALFEVLRLQAPEWLAARLAELAAADPALAGRLLDAAADADVLGVVADLRSDFDEALGVLERDARDCGPYEEWYPDTDDLDELLDEAEALVDEVPDAVRELADHVMELIERVLNVENCYGEGVTEALTRAEDLHLDACRAGSPDPVLLAQRLVSRALTSQWGSLASALPEYAEVLGPSGLDRCRQLAAQATGNDRSLQALRKSLARIEENGNA